MAAASSAPSTSAEGSPPPKVMVPNWGRALEVCLLLAVLTLLLYSPLHSHLFLNYDDEGYITRNAHIQAGLTWQTIGWAFHSTDMGNWHPVTWLSHALDFQLFGNWAGGHHIVSLILHVANVALLFLLLVRATGSMERSAVVAALFAVHPINVESIAWVAERKNVLSTLFFLLALASYGQYARKPSTLGCLRVAGLYVLGLASKPMLVTFPFVLLLLDYWPLQRIQGWTEPAAVLQVQQQSWQRLLVEKVPLLILSVASSAITLAAQKGSAISESSSLSLGIRLENAVFSYAMYVFRAVWPAHLAPIYPHPGNSLTWWQIGSALVFLVLVSAWAWHFRRTRQFLLIGWLWFLGTLVPVIGLVQVGVQAMADRYAYIPLIGVFAMLVWGAGEFAEAHKARAWFRGGAVAVVAVLAVAARRQIQYWKTPYDLWSRTLAVTKNNYVAEDNMATTLLRMGNVDALAHFQNASHISPNDPVSHGALAGYFQDQGRFQEAISYYQVAIRNNSDPDMLAVAEANLAIIYRQTGEYAKARDSYGLAARTSPQALREMLEDLTQRLAVQPTAEGYFRLGLLLDVARRLPEARSAYQKALQLNPALEGSQKALVTVQ